MSMPAEPSWSQSGEDRILHSLFDYFSDRTRLSYADIGAAFPDSHNNSYLSYTLGGRGLLVEADPSYGPLYQGTRPDDVYVYAALVPERLRGAGSVLFHLNQDRGRSTASPEYAAMVQTHGFGTITATLSVPCLTINELLARNPLPELDFISIDIEGFDLEVLAELDADRFDPKVVIAENDGGAPVHKEVMEAKGYSLYAFTFINSVYVRRRHFRL